MNMTVEEHGKSIRNKIIEFIVSFIKENQYPPTVKEIGNGVGLKSNSSVVMHLIRLREEGKINYIDYQPRTITVPGYKFVKDSEWIKSKDFGFDVLKGYRCKNCNGTIKVMFPYCPWCGSEMKNCITGE